MATGSPNREFSTEELDAMAAAELPVHDGPIPPNASTAPAAASGAPEPTGSAGLIAGEGTPFSIPEPPRGPAMGPVAKLEAGREYSTEELDLLEQANKPKEFTSDELDQKIVASVYDDPTYIPTRDEYFEAKQLKARLKSEGKIPGLLEDAATGAQGFLQTIGDTIHEISDDPGEFLARAPATMKAIAKKSWRNTNDVTRWIRQTNAPTPIGRDEQTGEFVFGQSGAGRSDAEVLAGQQQAAAGQGRSIRAVTEEDLKDEEFDRFVMERSRQKELEEWVASTTAPTEFITRLTTGRNQTEQPMQATSDLAGGLLEPTNIATMGIPLGAGAKTLGLSRLTKAGGARAARVLDRAAAKGIAGMETGAAKFQEIIQKFTKITPENQIKMAKWSAAGGIGGGVFGLDSDIPGVSQAQDAAKFIGGAYIGYRAGLGVLRTVQKIAGPTATILRVASDAGEGFDAIAQASVATKLEAFPELSLVREALENPTRFRPIESTPARLAADPRLGKQTRAIADALASPAIVQGVRGASAVATGAVKGAVANAPFVALALNADEEKAAANMLGLGVGFGTVGGAAGRFTGLKQRRAESRAFDTARMLMDVELAGGDVGKTIQTYSTQQLGDLAAMQGFFRDKVDFVPLGKADFDSNTQALGGAGAAGLHVQAPPGEKARVFVNLDAKRDGIVPHELGHALLKSGALGSAQADTIRSFTTRRYTQAGVEARGREYATAMIQNENAAKFPGQNFPVTPAAITAKMDELGQSGLLRGDMDHLDWARDEIFAEDFRQASQSMDFAGIRRHLPADGSWLGSMENLLGAKANALSISGVRIDPVTGQPDPLFKANPILATDPILKKQLDQYLNNYRNWINHPEQTQARGVRVAPTGRASDFANNPQVTFHDYGNGVMANEFARIDPATGQAVFREQSDITAETLKRQQQVKSLVGSKLIPATDPNLGPKKTSDGRVTVRGRILPQQFDFLNGFAQHQRGFARQFETAAATGESMQVRYHAIGNGDTGAFRIKSLGNLEAITREVIPWGWELSGKNNLLASVLDLTQFRNRAIKAINAGDPTIGRLYNNDIKLIEADLKQWMDNHRQDLPGSNKIGEQRRDAINSIIGIATNINKAANPFSGKIAGPSSAIKQFRIDRVDAAVGTGRQGFHFDYDKANNNLLPEIPTPLPDLSRDLPTGQAMPDAKPLKPIEQMTDRQLSSFLRKHGEQPSSALDVARRWSDGDRMWGAHEMGDELSLSPITDMNDLSGYSRDRLISLPKATEDALYNPQGQAMPDAVAGQFMPDTWTSVQDAPEITMKDLVGRKVFPTMADRMAAGTIFRGIDSSEIAVPIETHGGPEWPLIQQEKVGEETNVWTNQGKGVSSTKAKRADEGAVMLVTLMDGNAHLSNTETASAIISTNAAYARDNRMSPEGLAAIDTMIRKDIPNFPGIEDPNIVTFVNSLPFQGKQSRARIAEVLASKEAEEHGAANVQRILDETRSKPYEGGRLGDSVLAIELTKGAPVMELGTMGAMAHPSYQYAVRGRVLGKFKRPVNMELIYEDFLNERRVQGKPQSGDRRAIDLARPVQFITEELANKVTQEKYEHLKSPNHAKVLTQALNDKWRDTTMSVKDGGASPADFISALNASEAKLALDRYTLPELKEKIKTGAMSIHQLGDSQVFFGIKSSDPATGYGLDPVAYGFGPNEKTLSLVLNSEKQTGGMGDAIVLKALQLGVTALDCFAVKSEAHPNGMLPALYRRLGFEKAGEIPFDDTFYTAKELADLKQYWKRSGWDESTGNPSIVLMKWKGNDEIRQTSLREFTRQGGSGVRGGIQPADFVGDTEGRNKRPPARQDRGPQRRPKQSDAGRGEGSQGTPVSGVQLGSGTVGAINELLGMKPADLKNLGIRAEDLAAFK